MLDILYLFTNLICSGLAGNARSSGLPASKETPFTSHKVTVSLMWKRQTLQAGS